MRKKCMLAIAFFAMAHEHEVRSSIAHMVGNERDRKLIGNAKPCRPTPKAAHKRNARSRGPLGGVGRIPDDTR